MSDERGSKWMSDAPRRTASAMTECTSFTTGASSAWSRSSMTSAASSSSSISSTASPSRESSSISAVDVLRRGDRAAHLVAGGHGDVVEREHVGRVGGRHQHGLLAEERDRDRLVAARLGGVDQARGALVDLERRSGRRSRARCARRAPGRAGWSRRFRRRSATGRAARHCCASVLDRLLHELALGEAELDDHVSDAALGPGPLRGRRESRNGKRAGGGGLATIPHS